MKKIGSILLALALILGPMSPRPQALSKTDLASTTAVLMDADTGEILFSKSPNKVMHPASITKIMTGLLVVEHCETDEVATASQSAVNIPSGYAHISLVAGDQMAVNDLMYALMLSSGNDAANVLAEHVGGSQANFAKLMTQRARELGAENTKFANASGITHKDHTTTAYDMALITQAAIRSSRFMKYYGATEYKLPATTKKPNGTATSNHCLMMLEEDKNYYNPDIIGGKIGFTYQAQHTMSTVARKDGRTLICVVMGSTTKGKYTDTEKLFDYGFNETAGGSVLRFYS